MKVGFTGHRPVSLFPDRSYKDLPILDAFAREFINKHASKIDVAIVGGALGWDHAVWKACLLHYIPVEVYVPCLNYQTKWPRQAQEVYNRLLENKLTSVQITPVSYSIDALMKRNMSIVDDCDKLVALYTGVEKGGTAAAINYTKKIGKPYLNVYHDWTEYFSERSFSNAPV